MTLFRNILPEVKIVVISYIAILIMASFGIIRIFYPTIPFVFSISDMLWVYSACLLLFIIPIKGKKRLFIVSSPYIAVIIDEIMQGIFPYYPSPKTHLASLFWTGTFDPVDLIAYTIGFTMALLTWRFIIKER